MLGTSCFASYAQWGTAPNKKPSSHYSCLKGQVATTATYHHPSWHFQSPITHHLTGHLKTLSPWLAALQQEIEVGMAGVLCDVPFALCGTDHAGVEFNFAPGKYLIGANISAMWCMDQPAGHKANCAPCFGCVPIQP